MVFRKMPLVSWTVVEFLVAVQARISVQVKGIGCTTHSIRLSSRETLMHIPHVLVVHFAHRKAIAADRAPHVGHLVITCRCVLVEGTSVGECRTAASRACVDTPARRQVALQLVDIVKGVFAFRALLRFRGCFGVLRVKYRARTALVPLQALVA